MNSKEMLFVPSGEFEMGLSRETADRLFRDFFPREADVNPYILYPEVPAHNVKVPAFRIAKHQVTNAEYKEFVDSGAYRTKELWKELILTPDLDTDLVGFDRIELFVDQTSHLSPALWRNCKFPEGKDAHPVEGISWFEAAAYCRWKKLRLPTEAEWEYSARGNDGRMFPWGNNLEVIDNWGDKQASTSTPVGAIPEDRSPFGVMDMARNVAEWVADSWAPYPNAPFEPSRRSHETLGIIRGGDYSSIHWRMRTTYRARLSRLDRFAGIGFRTAS